MTSYACIDSEGRKTRQRESSPADAAKSHADEVRIEADTTVRVYEDTLTYKALAGAIVALDWPVGFIQRAVDRWIWAISRETS